MKSMHNMAGVAKSVVVMLAAWLALVLFLGARGAFTSPAGSPPLPIILGVTVPMIVFLAAFWISRAFHDYVLNFDLRLAAGIQAWRFAGLAFLALSTNGVLPGAFAWPAGIGDMAIGITAPWIILALIQRPHFAASRWFVAWN